jgi:hypothetical protein
MSEVDPNFRPAVEACACGCGVIGRPRVKRWTDGLHHARGCGCRRCVGGRQRGKASNRERKIAKKIGGERHILSGALSGADVSNSLVDIEETGGEAYARGLRRWWESKAVQTKIKRLYQRRVLPHAFIVWIAPRKGLVVMTYEDWCVLAGREVETPYPLSHVKGLPRDDD